MKKINCGCKNIIIIKDKSYEIYNYGGDLQRARTAQTKLLFFQKIDSFSPKIMSTMLEVNQEKLFATRLR